MTDPDPDPRIAELDAIISDITPRTREIAAAGLRGIKGWSEGHPAADQADYIIGSTLGAARLFAAVLYASRRSMPAAAYSGLRKLAMQIVEDAETHPEAANDGDGQ